MSLKCYSRRLFQLQGPSVTFETKECRCRGATTLSKTTFGITALIVCTSSVTTLGAMTLGITVKCVMPSVANQPKIPTVVWLIVVMVNVVALLPQPRGRKSSAACAASYTFTREV
jgi:hypothetical protein